MTQLVSIVVRNRNEAEFLRFCFSSVVSQLKVETEIVLVDNDSTDDSLAIAREFDCKIVHLAKDEFTYGKALNLGMEAAAGEICVLLSAHSMLLGPYALLSCLSAFADERVAAARFLHSGKNFDAKRWMEPQMLDSSSDVNEVISKAPLANGCAVRRSTWQETQFNEAVAAAEEKIWSLDVLKKGWKILSPCPAVYAYLKKIPHSRLIEKNNRELQAVFDHTGVKLGHFKESMSGKLRKFAGRIVTAPVSAAYRTMVQMRLELILANGNRKKS